MSQVFEVFSISPEAMEARARIKFISDDVEQKFKQISPVMMLEISDRFRRTSGDRRWLKFL